MGSFYRRQEEMRLEISDGNWLLVRKYLTAGDERDAHEHIIKAGTMRPGEKPEIDLKHLGIAQVVSYLLDWSLTDVNDKPIVIRGQSYDFIAGALRDMTPEGLREILQAIEAHDNAMTAERAIQKKDQDGVSAPFPISTSAG